VSRRSAFISSYNESEVTEAKLAKLVFFNKDTSDPYQHTYSVSTLDEFDGADEMWMYDELPASHRESMRLNLHEDTMRAAVSFEDKLMKDADKIVEALTQAKKGKNFTFPNAVHIVHHLNTKYGWKYRNSKKRITKAMKERRITRTKDLFKFKTNTTKKQAIQPYYDRLLMSMAEVLTFMLRPLNVTITNAAGCEWSSTVKKVTRVANGRFNTIEAFKQATSANKIIAFSKNYNNRPKHYLQCPKFNKLDEDHIRKLFKDPKATAREKNPLIVDI
jgi:hypothetical protein